MQSATGADPLHVGIIMDGNGRWATLRRLPRHAGHRAGVEAIRRTVEAAPLLGVGTLTLYAFSSDNWRRPAEEVAFLMRLLRLYLRGETARLARSGTRLSVVGRRDRLPDGLAEAIGRAESVTSGGTRLHLRIAVDYSGRDAILAAARSLLAHPAAAAGIERAEFGALVSGDPRLRDVDLLVRTSGEQRLSDFLLWESAYAELYFTPLLWPDFGSDALAQALAAYACRERRFGGLPAQSQAA